MDKWTELYPAFQKRLLQLLADNHMTYEALAEKSGVSVSGIKKYTEAKDPVAPRVDQLLKIADVFDVSIDYLIGNSEERIPAVSYLSDMTGLTEDAINDIKQESMLNETEPFSFSVSNVADILNVFVGYIFEDERNRMYFERTVRNIRVLSDIVKDQLAAKDIKTSVSEEILADLETEATKRGMVMVSPELALRFYVDDLATILKNAVTKEVTDYMDDQARYFRKRSFSGR